jgi:uncharacterized protein (DUF1697 family)
MPIRDNFTPKETEDIITAAMSNLGLKRADAEKLLNHDRPLKRNQLLDCQWVQNLHSICEALREGRANPAGLFATVFWIRLYGVLVDLRSRYRKIAEAHQYSLELGKTNPHVAASAEVFHACTAIHESLSDDELIYATFVRHTEAHVYQDSFEYEVERGNPVKKQPAAVRTKQMISVIRRHVDVDEAHRIVDAIQRKANYDDVRIAVNFAHRVGPYVERLDRAMKDLAVQREVDRAASTARRPGIERSWLKKERIARTGARGKPGSR